MNILIESGDYSLDNMGDVAMLKSTLGRLLEIWPDSVLQVVTEAPERLAKYCPDSQVVVPEYFIGRQIWLSYLISPWFTRLQNTYRWKYPLIFRSWIERRMLARQRETAALRTFFGAVCDADLVVACGGGYLNDVFGEATTRMLSVMRVATQLRKPTALFGQGVGPVRSCELLAQARTCLPSVDLIAIRERRTALPILESIGVSPTRIMVTGDDAIELANRFSAAELGNGIGVGLRVSAYSGLNAHDLAVVGMALRDAARLHGAVLVGVPTFQGDVGSDVTSVGDVLSHGAEFSDGVGRLGSLEQLLRQVSRCRVVVAGTYHAGVFALAQGIPVIGLVRSPYYGAKLLGLADQFGAGCEVLYLDDAEVGEKLVAAIDRAWRSARRVRPLLLEAARRQAEAGRNAYRRLHELVETRS